MWIYTQRISILERNLSPRSTESLGTARSLKIHLVKTSTTFTCQTFTCASWTACRTVWITAICVDCDPKVHPMASQDVSVEDQVGMLKNPWTTQIELHLCTRLNPLHPETWPWPSPAALYALFSWHAFWFCQQVPGHWSRWGGFGFGMKSRNCMKLLGPLGTRCSHSHRSGLQDPAQHGIEVLPEAEVDGMKIWADLVMGCHGALLPRKSVVAVCYFYCAPCNIYSLQPSSIEQHISVLMNLRTLLIDLINFCLNWSFEDLNSKFT